MALETLSSNELLNFIIYDTISATPFSCCNDSSETTTTTTTNTSFFHLDNPHQNIDHIQEFSPPNNAFMETTSLTMAAASVAPSFPAQEDCEKKDDFGVNVQQGGGGRKKRRRRPRVCKNKEEAENQRMTHIAVERNRRKQMNEHLAVLRSLMPESYVQRGDQASIVGGAIEFVKELEHLLQTREAQKFLIQQQGENIIDPNLTNTSNNINIPCPFSQFFAYPQYTCSQISNKHTSNSKAAIADIEVTLIETHANLRILSRKRLTQLSKMVSCFQTLCLSVLHLNVTTLDPMVLYSISAKLEEGCRLNSADEIAGAIHQMLRIIEEEAATATPFMLTPVQD